MPQKIGKHIFLRRNNNGFGVADCTSKGLQSKMNDDATWCTGVVETWFQIIDWWLSYATTATNLYTEEEEPDHRFWGGVGTHVWRCVFRNIHAASGLGVERAKSYPRREFSRSLPHGDWPKSPLERAEPTHTPATCVCIAIGEKGEGPPRRDHPHFLCCYMTDLWPPSSFSLSLSPKPPPTSSFAQRAKREKSPNSPESLAPALASVKSSSGHLSPDLILRIIHLYSSLQARLCSYFSGRSLFRVVFFSWRAVSFASDFWQVFFCWCEPFWLLYAAASHQHPRHQHAAADWPKSWFHGQHGPSSSRSRSWLDACRHGRPKLVSCHIRLIVEM